MPHSRRVPPSTTALARFAGELDAFCVAEGVPAGVAWRLRVAVDEVVANILSHSGSLAGPPEIEVVFRRNGTDVQVVVSDDGPAFDPLARPDPDVTLPLDARQPGGLGIALVKSLMDEVTYERSTRNVLTLRKRIDGDTDVADRR